MNSAKKDDWEWTGLGGQWIQRQWCEASYGYEVGLYMYLFAVGSFPCLDRFFPGSHACLSVACELDFGVLVRIQARDDRIDVVSANLFAALELS